MSLETREDNVAELIAARDKGSLIECLDDGFVRLVDQMGTDAAIAQAARVSYGAGTKTVSDDRGLIRRLMRDVHTSPFEMVELKFHVRVPMDAWRQWIRHRTANVNEYSTRYSEAIDSQQTTQPDEWRLQSSSNKQGSSGVLEEWPEGWEVDKKARTISHGQGQHRWSKKYASEMPKTPGELLSKTEAELHRTARSLYEQRIALGVAREVARKDLPLSTYTEVYWKCDLHNLFHFLKLRMAEEAQLEIRTYANAMYKLMKPKLKIACQAFRDYRLNAITLSDMEIKYIYSAQTRNAIECSLMSKAEWIAFNKKLVRLGLPQFPVPA